MKIENAACAGIAVESGYAIFFDSERENEGKAICAGCPAIMECLEYGRNVNEGIYGGMNPDERYRYFRRQRYRSRRLNLSL